MGNDPVNGTDPSGEQVAFTDAISGDPSPPRKPLMTIDNHSNLEHGTRTVTNAIVLHRTVTSTAQSVLNNYNNANTTVGATYLIDKKGNITQTAARNQTTYHVGRVRARCEPNCTSPRNVGTTSQVHTVETGLPYPDRYPTNGDSVGIEFVGDYDAATSTWDQATRSQLNSGRDLVNWLEYQYGLKDTDIYHHDNISRKTAGEGSGLGYD